MYWHVLKFRKIKPLEQQILYKEVSENAPFSSSEAWKLQTAWRDFHFQQELLPT